MATDTALPLHANLSTRDADHGYNPAFVDMTLASSALPADEFLTNLGDCNSAFAESRRRFAASRRWWQARSLVYWTSPCSTTSDARDNRYVVGA